MELPGLGLPKIDDSGPKTQLQQAMYDVADALVLPTDHHGRVYDLRYLIPILAFHLARAGIGKVEGQAVIKKRRLPPAPGVMDGAVQWVPLSYEDTVEDELDGVTLDDIDQLSPVAKAELIRRLGGDPKPEENPDLDAKVPWTVQTNIQFEDED